MGSKAGAAKARAAREAKISAASGNEADQSQEQSNPAWIPPKDVSEPILLVREPLELRLADVTLIEAVQLGPKHQRYLNPTLDVFRRANLELTLRDQLVWVEWDENRSTQTVRRTILIALGNVRWMTAA